MEQQLDKHQNDNTALKSVGVLLMAALGGFLSRWHGGGFISGTPKLLKAFLWSLPFAAVSGWAFYLDGHSWLDIGIVAFLVLVGCMVFKNTGHGGGMDLAHNSKEPWHGREPEKLEILILWLHGKIPQYWYDALLLGVIGLASTIAPAIAIGIVNPLAGLIVLAGGMLGKQIGYMIGWALDDAGLLKRFPSDLDHATAIGELLTGVFAYSSLSIAIILLAAM